MYKPGAIRKVTVKDFVTYSYVEMYPGPHLNMLIGPNGTGKSTIVAAIILGLGGNPKTIGRGTKVSEYVKHNCNSAHIIIHLQGNDEDELISIARSFDLHEKNTWKLNDKEISHKHIQKVIKQFNIQVDNLCQFLPQDRVEDFAKLNKQQLLQQTQIALCRHDLLESQQKLIHTRERHKELLANLDKFSQKLQESKDANIRLEAKVNNFNRKKKYLNQIEHVDRKVNWLAYESAREKYEELKVDRTKATEVLNKHKEEAKPIQNAINNAKKVLATAENKINDSTRLLQNAVGIVNNKLENFENLKNVIRRIEADAVARLQEEDRRDNEIEINARKIDQLAQNRNNLVRQYGDDNKVRESTHQMQQQIRDVTTKYDNLSEQKEDIDNAKREKSILVQRYERELQQLENVKQRRLDWLRQKDRDAYAAVQWLRANKHMFKGEIYEPMILELNVLNSKNAVYFENMIPMRDRLAFTCTLKEDMNLLIRMLREQQQLSVNIIYSGRDQNLQSFQPTIPIEQLKCYGMFAYLHSLVTGPEPIMAYLCKTYRLHCTPVGNHITNQRFEDVPKDIRVFFSDKYRFSTIVSRYTGAKSTKQSELIQNGSFSVSVDAIQMENVQGLLQEAREAYNKIEDNSKAINNQLSALNDKQNNIRNEMKNIQNSKQQIQALESRIRMTHNKIEQLKASRVTKEEIEQQKQTKIKDVVKKIVLCQDEIKVAYEKYSEASIQSTIHKTSLTNTRKQVAFLENKASDILQLCQVAEQTLNHIKELFSKASTDARLALQKAKQVSNGCTPDDDGFEQFREIFNQLSDDRETLQAEKDHILSKIDCLNTADDGEIQEYEERLELISKINDDIASANTELDKINRNMTKLQEEWLEPLQELVSDINRRFSASFQRMGCDGEIDIYKGVNEQDFSEYGLSIKVKFRETEMLQELNSTVQSGGERAVSTAIFMLSLQELTPVPFRCVDEINQGMDPSNERRIFELLVDSTSEEGTSQYFFITPKLISNLKYIRSMKIHIVHNGPFVCSQKEWNRVNVEQRISNAMVH